MPQLSDTAISISKLSKTYVNGKQALQDISIDIKKNDFFGLLGPNGAGKSTLIQILTSLTRKSTGSIHIFNQNIDKDFAAIRRDIGIVPQELNLMAFEKVKDILINQAGFYGIPYRTAKQRAEYFMKKLHLFDKKDSQARMLSGGMKRRLMIARSLLHHPKILILDEPTAGVDVEIRRATWKFIEDLNRNGTTILLTSHYLEEIENFCNNVAIINHGRLIKKSSLPDLLKTLNHDQYLLTTTASLPSALPKTSYDISKLNSHTLQLILPNNEHLSDVFSQLEKNNICIDTIKNKQNRLEEIFLDLVHEPQRENTQEPQKVE